MARGCIFLHEITAGRICRDRRTKQLIHRLRRGDVALVSHPDLDSVVAEDLIRCGVSAVLNTERSFTGGFCTPGPRMLIEAGVVMLDRVDGEMLQLREGARVVIRGDQVYLGGRAVAQGHRLTLEGLKRRMGAAQKRRSHRLEAFVDNTLRFARREKSLLLEEPNLPRLKCDLKGRPALVVVRGRNYREDIRAVRSYVLEQDPAIVAVDGAADALAEAGWLPDVLLGDMDSVSDEVLRRAANCGCELVVHAYPDGSAPGLNRLRDLGLSASRFCVLGTSEDAALLLAHLAGASLIVAVGTHTDPVEFLEKGRPGMASTVLVRLRIGDRLVDAKGVSQLYRTRPRTGEVLLLLAAGLAPALAVLWLSPSFSLLLRLLALHVRVLTAGG